MLQNYSNDSANMARVDGAVKALEYCKAFAFDAVEEAEFADLELRLRAKYDALKLRVRMFTVSHKAVPIDGE